MSRSAMIIEAARGWIATPYAHGASLRGAGADCLGLLRGIWREVVGPEPETPPPYAPLWAEESGEERLRDALSRHLRARAVPDAEAGDVLLFRVKPHGPAKHAAVLTGEGRMIHALEARGVVETSIGSWWARRRAYAFRFPE